MNILNKLIFYIIILMNQIIKKTSLFISTNSLGFYIYKYNYNLDKKTTKDYYYYHL